MNCFLQEDFRKLLVTLTRSQSTIYTWCCLKESLVDDLVPFFEVEKEMKRGRSKKQPFPNQDSFQNPRSSLHNILTAFPDQRQILLFLSPAFMERGKVTVVVVPLASLIEDLIQKTRQHGLSFETSKGKRFHSKKHCGTRVIYICNQEKDRP